MTAIFPDGINHSLQDESDAVEYVVLLDWVNGHIRARSRLSMREIRHGRARVHPALVRLPLFHRPRICRRRITNATACIQRSRLSVGMGAHGLFAIFFRTMLTPDVDASLR
jgi:hypothetical protein